MMVYKSTPQAGSTDHTLEEAGPGEGTVELSLEGQGRDKLRKKGSIRLMSLDFIIQAMQR